MKRSQETITGDHGYVQVAVDATAVPPGILPAELSIIVNGLIEAGSRSIQHSFHRRLTEEIAMNDISVGDEYSTTYGETVQVDWTADCVVRVTYLVKLHNVDVPPEIVGTLLAPSVRPTRQRIITYLTHVGDPEALNKQLEQDGYESMSETAAGLRPYLGHLRPGFTSYLAEGPPPGLPILQRGGARHYDPDLMEGENLIPPMRSRQGEQIPPLDEKKYIEPRKPEQNPTES